MRANNEQLISLWLEGKFESGKNYTGSLHFKSDVMYSYSTPIAYRRGKYVLVNADRYSVTTSAHETLVYNHAHWHRCKPSLVSFGLLEQFEPLLRSYRVVDVFRSIDYEDDDEFLIALRRIFYSISWDIALLECSGRKYLSVITLRPCLATVVEVSTEPKTIGEAIREIVPLKVNTAYSLGDVVWSLEWFFVPVTNMYVALSMPDLKRVKEEKNYVLKHPTAGTVWEASRAKVADGKVFVSGVVKRVHPPARFLSCRGTWYEVIPANVGMVRREAV